ncbi:MAG: hypothetical protein KDD06_18860, partial [Phaeodactylibacter sp.]|nr:hypothetical protein [Phaeodactylibacter sp.]
KQTLKPDCHEKFTFYPSHSYKGRVLLLDPFLAGGHLLPIGYDRYGFYSNFSTGLLWMDR